MKIAGIDPNKPVQDTIVLPRGNSAPVSLTIQALPLGMEETALAIFPVPKPPMRPVPEGATRKGSAPIFMRGDDGRLILRPDPNDAEYKKENRRHNQGFSAFVIYHGLQGDASVTFDVSKELKESDPAAFYLGVYEEMKTSGLSAGDVIALVTKIMDLSNFDAKKVDAAKRDFMAAGGADE